MNSFKSFSLLFYFTFFALTAQEIESNSQTLLQINTEKSTLKWIGEKITTSQHSGSLDFKSGEMTIKDGLVVSGSFIVDMTSISVEDISGSGKKRLEGHLKSDDFFSVDKHDKALLSIKGSKKTDKGFLVDANLTIKNLTHPIQFNMVSIEGGYNADLVFDRSNYNVRFRSGSFFENLGDKLIIDDIVLSSELRF